MQQRLAGGVFVIIGIGIAYIGWGTWWLVLAGSSSSWGSSASSHRAICAEHQGWGTPPARSVLLQIDPAQPTLHPVLTVKRQTEARCHRDHRHEHRPQPYASEPS